MRRPSPARSPARCADSIPRNGSRKKKSKSPTHSSTTPWRQRRLPSMTPDWTQRKKIRTVSASSSVRALAGCRSSKRCTRRCSSAVRRASRHSSSPALSSTSLPHTSPSDSTAVDPALRRPLHAPPARTRSATRSRSSSATRRTSCSPAEAKPWSRRSQSADSPRCARCRRGTTTRNTRRGRGI